MSLMKKTKENGWKVGTITIFKNLEAVVSDDGLKPKVLSRVEQATSAIT